MCLGECDTFCHTQTTKEIASKRTKKDKNEEIASARHFNHSAQGRYHSTVCVETVRWLINGVNGHHALGNTSCDKIVGSQKNSALMVEERRYRLNGLGTRIGSRRVEDVRADWTLEIS